MLIGILFAVITHNKTKLRIEAFRSDFHFFRTTGKSASGIRHSAGRQTLC